MKFMYSILVSCLLFIGQAQATNFSFWDATSFSPEQVHVQAANIGVPVGTVIIWTKEIIPDGWLECNGQPVNEALYPDLHKLMPNTPNYQGRFLQGTDTNTKVGEKIEAGLPNIWGAIGPIGIDGHTLNGAFSYGGKSGNLSNQGNWDIYANFNAARCSPIYGRSTTVQPPAVTVKYIIKAE